MKLCLKAREASISAKRAGSLPSCTVSSWPFCQKVFGTFLVTQEADTGLMVGCPLQGHLGLLPDSDGCQCSHGSSFPQDLNLQKRHFFIEGQGRLTRRSRRPWRPNPPLPLFYLWTVSGWQDTSWVKWTSRFPRGDTVTKVGLAIILQGWYPPLKRWSSLWLPLCISLWSWAGSLAPPTHAPAPRTEK